MQGLFERFFGRTRRGHLKTFGLRKKDYCLNS